MDHKTRLQQGLNWPNLLSLKDSNPENVVREGECAHPESCPLSNVTAGTVCSIKHLTAAADVTDRLRELGFCEDQRIKLLSRDGNLICQVCNARLGISAQLAESIIVTPHAKTRKVA
jgi:Fe2+ transport system protein FeoA